MKIDDYEDWREDNDIDMDVIYDIENDVLAERGLMLDTSSVRGDSGSVFLGEDSGMDVLEDIDEAFCEMDIQEYEAMETEMFEESLDEDGYFDAEKYRTLFSQWIDRVIAE